MMMMLLKFTAHVKVENSAGTENEEAIILIALFPQRDREEMKINNRLSTFTIRVC